MITLDPYTTVTGSTGTGTDDRITGTNGANTLDGGAGNDLIIGGRGNDTLIGGMGSDVFRWGAADHGSSATPAQDTIMDWSTAATRDGGDVLDLRDLLVGESHGANLAAGVGNLANYLHFEYSGANTIVSISSTGLHTAGLPTSGTDLTIVLNGVDLVGAGLSDAQIIANLLANGKLLTD